MAYYVYIIQSELDGSYYKGFTEMPETRLQRHNNKESTYTAAKIPWAYVFLQSFQTKKEALIREKSLKKYSHQQIQLLIKSKLNEIENLK
jgi:putative endonuclease